MTREPRPSELCKICGAEASFFGEVDFAKNCNEPSGFFLPPTGEQVAYHRCVSCGFLFTCHLDRWTTKDFVERIYNESYVLVDEPYLAVRPARNASFLRTVLDEAMSAMPGTMLDYGCGNGRLSELLADRIAVFNHDPMSAVFQARPASAVPLVFSSEVLEHVADPRGTAASVASCVQDEGVVLFSTTLQPADIVEQGLSWWYVGPRNGHISLYTAESLRRLWAREGLSYEPLSDEWHVAFRRWPGWASRGALEQIVRDLPTGFVPM